ncbi:MAG: hypothetical protein ACP59X_21315 [Solidesulfovibrio sp. DCME]|uniref:hypothetical protein n=1 Tax=Solidesulfovibrio sp. DCME TaxID=3447380 RepID=UPI003D11042A
MALDDVVVDNDLKKIHNEINTLGNVRVVIAIGAVSALGFAVSAGLKFTPPQNSIESMHIAILVNWIWGVVLILNIASLAAWKRVRLYAAYLRFKDYSYWERDWHAFRFERVEDDKLNCFRNELRRIDVQGFGGVFIYARILICIQTYYMVWAATISVGEPLFINPLYSIVPIACSIALWLGFSYVFRESHNDEYGLEKKMIYIWCILLRKRHHSKKCGEHYCCECCVNPRLIHKLDSHSGR